MKKGRESDSEKERDRGGDRANKRERGKRDGQEREWKWEAYSILRKNLPNGEIKRKQRLITRNYRIKNNNPFILDHHA